MNKNILIIEDEVKVSEVIKAYLEKEGYKVVCVATGLEGLETIKEKSFQLILLDLMLPDIDGETVCRHIREFSDIHIFMLTAKGSLEDKIEGLSIGADEYLVKPISPREVTARVNSLFRRLNRGEDSSVLTFDKGKFIIDINKREVRVNNQEINLTPNEFNILYALASNRGNVLTREQLIERAVGLEFEGFDRTIDTHIKNLRKKIEEDSKSPKYIITVVKVGYKFGGES